MKSIFASAPESAGAEDYENLIKELLGEMKVAHAAPKDKVIPLSARRAVHERVKKRAGA